MVVGWFWLVLAGCGWFWLVPRFSMYEERLIEFKKEIKCLLFDFNQFVCSCHGLETTVCI